MSTSDRVKKLEGAQRGNKRGGDRLEILAKRRTIVKMRRQGYTLEAISERVGLSKPTICRHLMKVRETWAKQIMSDYEAWQQEIVDQNEYDIQQAQEAFERSTRPLENEHWEQDENGKIVKRTFDRRGQCGDPSFLAIKQKARDQIAKVRGLYAPEQMNVAAAVQVSTAEARQAILQDAEYQQYIEHLRERALENGDSGTVRTNDQQPQMANGSASDGTGSSIDGNRLWNDEAADGGDAATPRQE